MSLTNYKPAQFLSRMQHEFDEFYKFNGALPFHHVEAMEELKSQAWIPNIDIKEDDREFIVKADIPGVNPEDIEVSLENNYLSIKGERKYEKEENTKNYHIKECSSGVFERRVKMPNTADENRVEAKNKQGVLTITIAKKLSAKPKLIEVKS